MPRCGFFLAKSCMHSYSALVPAPARTSIALPKEWRDGLEREQGPFCSFSPAQTQTCSCLVRCAEVMVTEPCVSTNALRNTAVASISGRLRRSRFLSSYVLQSYLGPPAHCRSSVLMNAIAVIGPSFGPEPSAWAAAPMRMLTRPKAKPTRMLCTASRDLRDTDDVRFERPRPAKRRWR